MCPGMIYVVERPGCDVPRWEMCPGEICVVEKPQCYVPRSGGVNEKQCCRLPIDLMKKKWVVLSSTCCIYFCWVEGIIVHICFTLLASRRDCTYRLYAFGFEGYLLSPWKKKKGKRWRLVYVCMLMWVCYWWSTAITWTQKCLVPINIPSPPYRKGKGMRVLGLWIWHVLGESSSVVSES